MGASRRQMIRVLSRALKQGLGDTGWEESHPKWPLVSSNHDHAMLELGKVHVPEARSRRVGRSLTGASRRGNERQRGIKRDRFIQDSTRCLHSFLASPYTSHLARNLHLSLNLNGDHCIQKHSAAHTNPAGRAKVLYGREITYYHPC